MQLKIEEKEQKLYYFALSLGIIKDSDEYVAGENKSSTGEVNSDCRKVSLMVHNFSQNCD